MQNDCFPDAPADWSKATISELADVNPSYRLEKGREYPFVEMASVGEDLAGIQRHDWRTFEGSGLARFKVNDTLFAKITPCPQNGKIAFVRTLPADAGLGSTEFTVLSPTQGTDPRFLFHLLCTHAVRGRAAARMEGSTGRQRVPDDVFKRRLLVPTPPWAMQVAIGRLLDAAEAATFAAQSAAYQSEELRRSVVAHLLLGGSAATDSAANRPFVDTRAGRLPSDWRISTVADEFSIKNGITLNAKARANQQPRSYLRVANVQRSRLDLSDIQTVGVAESEFNPRRLELDDLLIVEGHADRMQIGRCAVVTSRAVGMTFQNHLFRLRSLGDASPKFACLWFNSDYAQQYWNARCATSSGLNTINQRTLKKMIVPVPPPAEQERIAAIDRALRLQTRALIAKARCHQELRKSLADAALTGALCVDSRIEWFQEAAP